MLFEWSFSHLFIRCQCDQTWQNFATLSTFYELLSNGWGFIQCFGKFLSLLWQNCNVFGQPFNVVYGQILKDYIVIWSHCPLSKLACVIFLIPYLANKYLRNVQADWLDDSDHNIRYYSTTYFCFLLRPNPGLFLLIFVLFKHKIYRKNL